MKLLMLVNMTRCSLILLLTCVMISLSAQSTEPNTSESETWLSLRLKKKINKKLDFNLRTESRLIQDDINRFLIEPNISVDLTKKLSIATSYRLTTEDKKNGRDYKSRIDVALKYKLEVGSLDVDTRLMYNDVVSDNGFGSGKRQLRLKSQLEYPLFKKRLTPSAGAELFRDVELGAFDRMRYNATLEYELTKSLDIVASYRLEDFYQEPVIGHIYMMAVKYKL